MVLINDSKDTEASNPQHIYKKLVHTGQGLTEASWNTTGYNSNTHHKGQ